MKNYVLVLLCAFLVFACEKDGDADQINNQQQQQDLKGIEKAGKVAVCHNGHLINVSSNAIRAHSAHGDAIDLDGDGYFNQINVCSELIDCDDTNPDIQDVLGWSGVGVDTNGNIYNISVQMACDFAAGTVDYGICIGTLTLVSQVGNVYTYSETATAGCVNNCEVVLEVLGNGSLDFTEDCGPAGMLSANLSPI